MRRKVVASFMAIVLCALMVLPQVGLAVRDAAVDPGTVIEPSAESSAQQTPEVQESEDQGDSVPTADAGEGPSDMPAPTEQAESSVDAVESGETDENASALEQRRESDDSSAQGAEHGEDTPEDVPNDSQPTDVPATDAPPEAEEEPATDQEPVAEEAPEDGEQPAEEAGSRVYTLSDVDEIIGSGISLASLQELMPVSIDSGKAVPEKYFKFALAGLTGNETKFYHEYSALQGNQDGYKVGPWPGNASGDVTDAMFPEIENLSFDALTLNGTIIESIGMVTVTVLGEGGSPITKDYVYFSPTVLGANADAMVLPDSVDDTHLFEARYVYATYNITYEVYLGEQNISSGWLDKVFGTGRTKTTKD